MRFGTGEGRVAGTELAVTAKWTIVALAAGGLIHLFTALWLGWALAAKLSVYSLLASVGAFVILRMGWPRLAVSVALFGSTAVCSYSAYAQEGLQNIAITILPVLAMFGSLLLDRRLLVVLTLAIVCAAISIPVLRQASGIEPLHRADIGDLVLLASTILLASLAGHVMSDRTRTALTRLEASELRWQLAIGGSNDGIFDWNAVTDGLWVSERWKTMLGYAPDEIEGTARDWERLVHPEDLDRVEAIIAEHLEGKTEYYAAEYRMLAKDGTYRWILARGKAHRDSSGRVVRMAGSHSDITERKNAEARAEAASRAKSEFVANVSHELRSPMNALVGLAELLKGVEDEAERREYMTEMAGCARAQLELLTQLMDFSRIEAGGLALARQPFSLRELAESTAGLLAGVAGRNQVRLRLRVSESVPEWLIGDAGRCRQVLMNLLDNALKFTRGGEAGLELDAAPGPSAEGVCLVHGVVWDQGKGIPREAITRVFEPFFQADASETREHGGIGLGLAICAKLISAMGGRLWVESVEGEGASFHFTIPFPVSESGPGASPAGGAAPGIRPARILLAEDNPLNQRVAKRLLERDSHAVTVASDGDEAVALAAAGEFDLILMDLHMPRKNGADAAAEIRRGESGSARRVPIWALTAAVSDDDRRRCREAGMDGFLAKPIELNRLRDAIRSATAEAPGVPASP
jgi:PAS domain S-box-containing protein